jgi:hypothetical protein
MSTTSSSRASRAAACALPALLLAAAAAAEAPRPTLARVRPTPAAAETRAPRKPVELRAATLLRRPAPDVVRLAGPAFFERAPGAVVVEVRTAEPLDVAPRTSWPVVVLDGRPVEHTRLDPEQPDRLLAFVPRGTELGRDTRVEVYWVGNEALTRTRKPLTLREAEPH